MPVLIGWSAVTNSLSWAALVLFAVIFFWTPPHFWALAMRFKDDYARASVPMLPVVATPETVARRMVAYSWAMVGTSVLLAFDGSGAHLRRLGRGPRRGLPASRRTGSSGRSAAAPTTTRCGCSTGRSPTWRCCSSRWRWTSSCSPRDGVLGPRPRPGRRAAAAGPARPRASTRASRSGTTRPSTGPPSTWSWSTRPGTTSTSATTFLAWAASVPRLLNTADVIAWNTDKTYLRELEAAGIPIVPDHLGGAGSAVHPAGSRLRREAHRVGVAPGTPRPTRRATSARSSTCRTLHAIGRDVMVQPYVTEVDELGETSLLFFDGAFSHAARKSAILTVGAPVTRGRQPRLRQPGRRHPEELALAERILEPVAARRCSTRGST